MSVQPLTLVVIAANVFGAAMALPQARKLMQNRRVAGVSLSWATVSATVNAWWGAYGIGVDDWSIVPVSVVSVLAYLSIAVAIVRFRNGSTLGLLAPAAAATLIIGAIPALALVLDGWVTAGIVLGALYGIQLAPAVVGVYRSVDVTGVSIATWLIALTEAVLWGVYGLAKLDVGLLALAGTGTTMSSLVLARLFLRRPQRTYRPVGVAAFAGA